MFRSVLCVSVALLFVLNAGAQQTDIVWSALESPLYTKIRSLRDLPDKTRATATKQLALEIRALPVVPNKLRLAVDLTNLSTEGDFGRDTLQEVTTTLTQCLREQPQQSAAPYTSLAQLVKYERMQASLDSPQFDFAMTKLAGRVGQ